MATQGRVHLVSRWSGGNAWSAWRAAAAAAASAADAAKEASATDVYGARATPHKTQWRN